MGYLVGPILPRSVPARAEQHRCHDRAAEVDDPTGELGHLRREAGDLGHDDHGRALALAQHRAGRAVVGEAVALEVVERVVHGHEG